METESREKKIQDMNSAVIAVRNRIRSNTSFKLFQEANARLESEKAAVKKTQDELKESMREFLSLAETEAGHLEGLSSRPAELKKKSLASELAKTEKEKEEVERELAGVTSTITHKKEVLKNLQNQATNSQQETSSSISKSRAKYLLYSKLSNIKWDHTVPEGTIKGFVLKPEERRVAPFKFDKTSHSQFFITNYLWEQINPGDDFLEGVTASSS